jgi:8-oxo-dGTP pyrophosphatase MutT (NUDIX family)
MKSPRKITEHYPPPEPGIRYSAVLLLLRQEADEWHVLLTRRSGQLADHRGQIAFPGGRAESGDSGPLQTALREACEEVGLPPDTVQPLGLLDPVDTSSGFRIWPVVGVIRRQVDILPSPPEVDETFWVPLDWLAAGGRRERRSVASVDGGGTRTALFFQPYQGRVIWGATAAILVQLLEILRRNGAE